MAEVEDATFPQFHSAEAQSIYISALSQLESGRPDAIIPDIVPLSVAEAITTRIGVAVGKVLHLKHYPDASSFEIKAENLDEFRSAKPKKKDRVPRPPNAFILYRQHHHNAVKAKNHGITNNDLSKKIGIMWKAESEAVRAEWKTKADRVKVEHALKFPGYAYQPRKPNEKKRRMTKKKTEAVKALREDVDLAYGSQVPVTLETASANSHPTDATHPIDTVSQLFPMKHDDPMRREFDLPTGVEAFDQFASNIDNYNSCGQVFTWSADGGSIESYFSAGNDFQEHLELANFEALIDWNTSQNAAQMAMAHANAADAELRDNALANWESDFA